jgi:hypothetical protein
LQTNNAIRRLAQLFLQTLDVQVPWPGLHVPQLRTPPQPSLAVPQLKPRASHVFVRQPQLFAIPPPPQLLGVVHVPQSREPPQPSLTVPQVSLSDAHVAGVHGPAPHWLGVVAPQVWVPLHVPHDSMWPQPSGRRPQLAFWAAHVVG